MGGTDEEPYRPRPDEDQALLDADAEVERGELVTAEDRFAELRRARARRARKGSSSPIRRTRIATLAATSAKPRRVVLSADER